MPTSPTFTHFIIKSLNRYNPSGITKGKIYKVENWLSDTLFSFIDDEEDVRSWYLHSGIEGVSYQDNLEKILE